MDRGMPISPQVTAVSRATGDRPESGTTAPAPAEARGSRSAAPSAGYDDIVVEPHIVLSEN